MNITLNLPPKVEQDILAEAQARGLSLDELVSEVVICPNSDGNTPHARLAYGTFRRTPD